MDYPKNRKRYPCEEVCPEDFISDEIIKQMIENKSKNIYSYEDWRRIFNCVHCNECNLSSERMAVLKDYLDAGFRYPGYEEILNNFQKFDTPYSTNQMRINKPKNIAKESKTLFFMGCLCTIRLPKYTEHALEYLIDHNVEFTILDKEPCCGYPALATGAVGEYERIKNKNIKLWKERGFKKIICLCPACYFIFKQDYPKMPIQFEFIADYLEPATTQKTGEVSVQHLCQLMNRGYAGYEVQVNKILEESGYKVVDIPHWCCGGGIGYVGRTDVIDKIAEKRMKDFRGDFYTTYCPGCLWILKAFKRHLQDKDKTKLMDIFELLS